MAEPRPPRLAVLIDADNASSEIAPTLFQKVAKLGSAEIRRIYGDFSGTRLQGWAKILAEHAIVPHQNFANAPGKNATDIALVIDAMDILHSGRVDGFCIVSSDSDFTRLATRIREQGCHVYGFGKEKTPDSFRKACHEFVVIDAATRTERKPSDATPLILTAMDGCKADEGWAFLGQVGKNLKSRPGGFNPRMYGYATLLGVVENAGRFEVRRGDGNLVHIRVKPTA
jgi:hypothetical protein